MATITRELEKRILNYMWFLGIIPICSLKLALEVLGKLSSSLKNSFANYFDIVITICSRIRDVICWLATGGQV